MDWPFDFLKELTVDLVFQRNGIEICTATTWVGYVGFLTASVPDKYSLAINYRRTIENVSFSSILKNVFNVMKMYWPIGYLIRELCVNNSSPQNMRKALLHYPLIAPCYITICYPDNDPEIITRNTTNATIHTGNHVVQTNCDQDKCEPNILYSVERRTMVNNVIKNKNNDIDALITQFLKYPVLNCETVYYTIMIPKIHLHKTSVFE